MKIAILSDIHGVSGAYRQALAEARREGFDMLVILGDLLTYGARPEETLALTREAIDRDGAMLLLGNHDQMYLDALAGTSEYVGRLPDWIRESYEWTRERTLDSGFWTHAKWLNELPVEELLISHANPFGAGDWSYLNEPGALQRACEVLCRRGFRWGIFGHVHRFRKHADAATGVLSVTVGSIGQPREKGGASQWAYAELSNGRLDVQPRRLDYDWADEIAAVEASSLSDATKERIVSYFA